MLEYLAPNSMPARISDVYDNPKDTDREGKMKKLFFYTALLSVMFLTVSCGGEESAVCGKDPFTCKADSEDKIVSNVCYEDRGKFGSYLFETCKDGCNFSTGKCNIWTDPDTNLTWSSAGEELDWEDALEYCDILTEAGYSDWRLPSIDELRTLIKNCPGSMTGGKCRVTDPDCLFLECEDSFDCDCDSVNHKGYYSKIGNDLPSWSSSTAECVSDSEYSTCIRIGYAWYVSYARGDIFFADKSSRIHIRCVRDNL